MSGDVWRCMMEQHSNTSCVITGSSTHNERVERLWRDVYRCVVVLFHDIEADGKLDPLNEVDVYCLYTTCTYLRHWILLLNRGTYQLRTISPLTSYI